MIRAVLDANVYVSAAIHPEGPPGRVVDAFLRRTDLEFVLSIAIAEEVLAALTYPRVRRHLRSTIPPELWFEDILLLAELTPGEFVVSGVCSDPDDDKYLAAAVEGRASFIVTGDQKLLAIGEYRGVRLLAPRPFLDLLRG